MKKADRYSTHISTHTPDIPGNAASRRDRHRSAAVPPQLCGEQWRGEDVREVGVELPSVRAQLLCGGDEVKLVADNLCQQHLLPAQQRRARRAVLVLLEHCLDEHARLAVEGQPQILLGVRRQTQGDINNVVRFCGCSPMATTAPNGADRRP